MKFVFRERKSLAFLRAKGSSTSGIARTWYQTQRNLVLRIISDYAFIFGSLWRLITKCGGDYYKMLQLFKYKMSQKFITKQVRLFILNGTVLLLNATVMQNVTFIELCIGYKASVVELFRSQRAVYINLLSFFLFFFRDPSNNIYNALDF